MTDKKSNPKVKPRVYKTLDQSGKVSVRIDSKTIMLIDPKKKIDLSKYQSKLTESRDLMITGKTNLK